MIRRSPARGGRLEQRVTIALELSNATVDYVVLTLVT